MSFFVGIAGITGVCVAGACLDQLMQADAEACIEVYVADWCPHCVAIKEEIAKLVHDTEGYCVRVYNDGTDEATKMQEKRGVTSFPTIIFTKGAETRVYKGARVYESIKRAALE